MARPARILTLGCLAVALAAGCGAEGEDVRGGRATETAPPPRSTGAAADLPNAVTVVCDGETTRVTTPRAAVARDGVHLRIRNTTARRLSWSAQTDGGGGVGADTPPGVAAHVVDVPPGELRIKCFDGTGPRDPGDVPSVSAKAVDPSGLWKPAVVDADCDRVSVSATFAEGAEGGRDPVAVVRDRLEEHDLLRPGDELTRAGYPAARGRARVALRRDGHVVAAFALDPDRSGGWLLAQTDACPSIAIG